MKCRTVIVLAACVALFVIGGQASAGVIIDESFDANTMINSPQPYALAEMAMMSMWMGGTTMADGMWMVAVDPMSMMYHAEGYLNMGMTMDGSWSTLAYFVAQPQPGWGGRQLQFSFDWQGDGFSTGLMAKYGVYGWHVGDMVCLESSYGAGLEGVALMEGRLVDSSDWHHVETSYIGDLSAFDFIGATFTMGNTTVLNGAYTTFNGDPVSLRVDNVRLETMVPEPTSMVLWATTMATAAYIRRRRRKKHRRAIGPPG